MARLRSHSWPGNVRELRNAVQRAFILSEDEIGPEAIPESEIDVPVQNGDVLQVQLGSSIEDVERRLILATLEELGGDKKRAAKTLGISLKTLYNRLNVYSAREDGD